MTKNRALFLDRDGVINVNRHYVIDTSDFIFVKGIFDVIKYFSEKYLIIIVTNQSGIARKYFSHEDLENLHEWMLNQFRMVNIEIDDIFYCPHHPEFDIECNCRKPKPGLILRAADKYNINLEKSILIGDSNSDIRAGLNAGINNNIKIESGNLDILLNKINNNEFERIS